MVGFDKKLQTINVTFSRKTVSSVSSWLERNISWILIIILSAFSIATFIGFLQNGLGLAYNDARSHLDIGRRVVEGLKPGLAQLGSVWLPLTHLLMVPTIWNDFMWHSGLSGALQSMVSFVATGYLIYSFLRHMGVSMLGRIVGVFVFVANLNILYLQSTAMTELLLLATMTAGIYDLVLWVKTDKLFHLVKASVWIMLSTLIRYDGWFLFGFAFASILLYTFLKKGYKTAEGIVLLFCTMAGFGIIGWLAWNQLIFKDALFFAFGPYSAHAQQTVLEGAGALASKHNLPLSLTIYLHAMAYNTGLFTLILGAIGAIIFFLDTKIPAAIRFMSLTLLAPLLFNIIALYLGHSVLYVQGISGDTWFNVRYGVMMVPSIAIFVGYLIYKSQRLAGVLLGLLLFATLFSFVSADAVTIDDATVGASQKNVTEVSAWLSENAKENEGFILISAASHDAIVFSSGLPMKRFIHEGTGVYWENATVRPDRWARWIIMRTGDDSDQTYKMVHTRPGFKNYRLVDHFPFADIYELKPEYLPYLQTKPILPHVK